MSNWVRFSNAQSGATDTTIACSLTGIAAGCLLVVCASSASGVTITVADDLSVAAVQAVQKVGVGKNIQIWYFKNYGGGNRTFTVTFSAGVTARSIVAIEYSGRDPDNPFDTSATGNGEDALPTLGPVTPAQNGSLFIGYMGAFQQPDAASPFEVVYNDTVNLLNSEDFIQTSAASLATTWTLPVSDFWAGAMAVFKPASPPPGPKISGTAVGKTEGELRAADKTIIITLTGGPTWIP